MKLRQIVLVLSVMLLAVLFANGIIVLAELNGRHSGYERRPIGYTADSGKIEAEQAEQAEQTGAAHLESSVGSNPPVNLLVLGLDKELVRTDVILLFNFEPELSRLNILSIARDTRVTDRGKYAKINALYSHGGEELVARQTSRITGLPVHYYITMDFKGFKKIVDMLDGVDFYVPFRMKYDDPDQNLHINLYKGMQHLDGASAEQLVRYRKGNKAGQGYTDGDIGRIRMQQDFIRSMLEQKLKLKYLNRVDDIFSLLGKYMRTNINIADIAGYIGSIGRIDVGELKTFTLPGDSEMRDGAWYFVYNRAGTREMIKSNFYY